MTVRAKFECESITEIHENNIQVKFEAVTSGSEENESFSKYTPFGTLTMGIDKDTPAWKAFEQGKEYYLDFSEAPKN